MRKTRRSLATLILSAVALSYLPGCSLSGSPNRAICDGVSTCHMVTEKEYRQYLASSPEEQKAFKLYLRERNEE
jgi:hypothetical protein